MVRKMQKSGQLDMLQKSHFEDNSTIKIPLIQTLYNINNEQIYVLL